MSRVRAVILGLFIAAVVAGAGGVVAMVVSKRVETGEWEVPNGNDLVRVKRRIAGRAREPSRIIYLHRGAVELVGGEDDAPRGRSSVVGKPGDRAVVPGFSGSMKRWRQIAACVKRQFSPFEVTVTDALPAREDYLMVVVGGRPKDLGRRGKHGHVRGLAPYIPGQAIPRAVVFAFSDALRNRPRLVCETIAMEVGHAYGLDHAHHCKDVMTYLRGCGAKSFTDRDARCGEYKARDCMDGNPTQNSYRHLHTLLGS